MKVFFAAEFTRIQSHFEVDDKKTLSEVTKRVTPSVTAPGDTNLSDATA